MNKNFQVMDLFSGCGGSALGFRLAGFQIKVAVDIDGKANETFRQNFPECSVITSDISYLTGDDIMKAGGLKESGWLILISCPPCQGFSNARRNSERLSDPRNLLVYEFVRITEEIRPVAFVMENVPGLATGIGRPIFLQVLRRLEDLGYHTIHGILDAADYGVPQRRKRLVLMGINDKRIRLSFPPQTNWNPELHNNLPSWKTVREAIGDLPPIGAGERSLKDCLHWTADISEMNLKRLSCTPTDGGDRTSWPEELYLNCHKKTPGHKDVYGRMKWDLPSPTVTGGCVMISKGRFGHPEQNRALSLREAARLQTLPDDYTFRGNMSEIAAQIGNAVPPLLTKRIAESLMRAMKETEISDRVVSGKTEASFNYPLLSP